jgi:hypothetical protein
MYTGVTCQSDADCVRYLGICDMSTNICSLPPLSSVEDSYLKCYLATISSSTEYYIRHSVLPDPLSQFSKDSVEFFSAVRIAASQPDCVSALSPLDVTKRSKYVWDGSSVECMAQALNLPNTTENLTEWVDLLCPARYCLGTFTPLISQERIHFIFFALFL